MKNLLEVLRMKEEQIQRLRREVEALKITARLLNEGERVTAAATASAPAIAANSGPVKANATSVPERRLEVRHLLQMP